MSERAYIAKNFDLQEILDFVEDNDLEIMKGPREGTYICLINYDGSGEPFATETNPIAAIINGIRAYYNRTAEY